MTDAASDTAKQPDSGSVNAIQQLLADAKHAHLTNPSTSITFATQAWAQAQQLPEYTRHQLALESALELAAAYVTNSKIAQAFDVMLQIRDMLPYHTAVLYTIRANSLLASIQIGYGDYTEALATLTFARELAVQAGNGTLEAGILSKMGLAYAWLGDFRLTVESLQQALAIHEQTPMTLPDIVMLLNNLAYTYVVTNQPDSGRPYALRGLALARQEQDIPDQVLLLGTCAEIEAATGNHAAAEGYLHEADRMTQIPGRERLRPEYVRALASYERLRGSTDRAIAAYEACTALAETFDLRGTMVQCFAELIGLYEQQGHYVQALAAIKRYSNLLDMIDAERVRYRMGIQKDLYRQELVRQQSQALVEQNRLTEDIIQEREQALLVQQQLFTTMTDMTTPILPVLAAVVVVPLIGAFHAEQMAHVQSQLLHTIEQQTVRVAILDITGMPLIDTELAGSFILTVQAAQLLGCTTILVGIRPEIAQSLVGLGMDLTRLITCASLDAGLRMALERVGYQIVKQAS